MSRQSNGDAPKITTGYAYYIFSLLFLLYTFDYIDRMVVSSLFPYIKRDWGISDTQCGMLVSAVYWSILIFSFPVSIFIDRWSRKKSIGIMAVVWSFATAAGAFTKSFPQLFATRSAIGIGEAGYAPGGTAMISGLFPERRRALMLGLWSAAIPLGSAIGIGLGGVIAEHLGWQHAFGLVALPGLVIAILFFFTRDYKSIELVKTRKIDAQSQVRKKMTRGEIVREFTNTRSLLLTYVGFAGNTFVTTALLCWLPTYFHRTQGMDESAAGLKSGSIMLFAIIGTPLGGYLADRWKRRNPNARLHFAALGSLATSIVLFFAFGFLEGDAQYAMLMLVGMLAPAFVPAAAAVTQDVIHPGLRATSYSLCVIVQNLLGSSLGPLFVGMASDRYDISTAMALLPAFSLLAGLLFFAASLYYMRDMALVEKVELEFE